MKKSNKLNRRSLLKMMGAGTAASVVPGSLNQPLFAAQNGSRVPLLCIYFDRGFSGIFSSADSYRNNGRFGVTGNNIVRVGPNGDHFVDQAFWNNISDPATAAYMGSNTATIGVNHGITTHPGAQASLFSHRGDNPLIKIADAMPGEAPIKIASVGRDLIYGFQALKHSDGTSTAIQKIGDINAAYDAFYGDFADTVTTPDNRASFAGALQAAQGMSADHLAKNKLSLLSLSAAYQESQKVLTQNQSPMSQADFATLKSDYGLGANDSNIGTDFASQLAAADLLFNAGTNVVACLNKDWDNHGDTNHNRVRNKMNNEISPPLKAFLRRNMGKVNVLLMGDFCRIGNNSGHGNCLSALVIGPEAKQGTTGRIGNNGGLPGTPGPDARTGFYSYLADITGAHSLMSEEHFGANPHQGLVQNPFLG